VDRRELEQRDHHFTTGSDAEVILHIYSEFGEQGFEKLNGMWAFALVDLHRRRVILSRDRFSIMPYNWYSYIDRLRFLYHHYNKRNSGFVPPLQASKLGFITQTSPLP
jgi:asparagine synthetase B (glutamine-hydrolysing)